MDAEFDQALAQARAERKTLDTRLQEAEASKASRMANVAARTSALEAEISTLKEEVALSKEVAPMLRKRWVPLTAAQRRLRVRQILLRVGLTAFTSAGIAVGVFHWQGVVAPALLLLAVGAVHGLGGKADEAERLRE